MEVAQDKLLEDFEDFEKQLEVEEILEKVKQELLLDPGVTEFGELLLEERRKRRKAAQAAQAAQAARATYVRQHWTPGCYPQFTTGWFIEGLDYRCDYWRYQFKRPLTPPPAPPPSPDASHKAHQTPRHDSSTKRRQ